MGLDCHGPQSKLLLVIDGGTRTLEMAQRVVHQVVQRLAPGCVPLFLTDGFREYMTALLAHFGHWMQPERRRGQRAEAQTALDPCTRLLYAQVVKSYRRRHIVGVTYRVIYGTMKRVQQGLSVDGRKINTAYVEVRPVGRKEVPSSG